MEKNNLFRDVYKVLAGLRLDLIIITTLTVLVKKNIITLEELQSHFVVQREAEQELEFVKKSKKWYQFWK